MSKNNFSTIHTAILPESLAQIAKQYVDDNEPVHTSSQDTLESFNSEDVVGKTKIHDSVAKALDKLIDAQHALLELQYCSKGQDIETLQEVLKGVVKDVAIIAHDVDKAAVQDPKFMQHQNTVLRKIIAESEARRSQARD